MSLRGVCFIDANKAGSDVGAAEGEYEYRSTAGEDQRPGLALGVTPRTR